MQIPRDLEARTEEASQLDDNQLIQLAENCRSDRISRKLVQKLLDEEEKQFFRTIEQDDDLKAIIKAYINTPHIRGDLKTVANVGQKINTCDIYLFLFFSIFITSGSLAISILSSDLFFANISFHFIFGFLEILFVILIIKIAKRVVLYVILVVFSVLMVSLYFVGEAMLNPKNGGDLFWYNFLMVFLSTFSGYCFTLVFDIIAKKVLFAGKNKIRDKVVPWQ